MFPFGPTNAARGPTRWVLNVWHPTGKPCPCRETWLRPLIASGSIQKHNFRRRYDETRRLAGFALRGKRVLLLDPAKFVDVKIDLPIHMDGEAPSPTHAVFYIDLNGDGVKEIIVRLGRDGHQEDMGIFQLQGGKWVDIGDFINGCYFCSKWNGYYQLEYYGNGGGQTRSRSLQRFIRGRYREVRDEILETGLLSEERINPDGLGD